MRAFRAILVGLVLVAVIGAIIWGIGAAATCWSSGGTLVPNAFPDKCLGGTP